MHLVGKMRKFALFGAVKCSSHECVPGFPASLAVQGCGVLQRWLCKDECAHLEASFRRLGGGGYPRSGRFALEICWGAFSRFYLLRRCHVGLRVRTERVRWLLGKRMAVQGERVLVTRFFDALSNALRTQTPPMDFQPEMFDWAPRKVCCDVLCSHIVMRVARGVA